VEYWLIEFFEDAYFLSAHVHKVTILPKDFNTLRIIRYRHERLLEPILVGDRIMSDILTLPPLHPRRVAQERPPTRHNRNTRSQVQGFDRDNAPIITEVPVIEVPKVDEVPVIEVPKVDEVPEVQPPNDSSQNRTLQARQLAVLEQDRVNRIAMEDYIRFDQVRVAFTLQVREKWRF